MRITAQCSSAMLLIIFACGCNRASSVYEVTGVVTLDGQPLKDGEVLFSAADNTSSSAGKIQAGRYRLEAAAGSHTVIINSSVKERNPHPQPPGAPRGDEWYYKSLIPTRYNDKTTLTTEVEARDDNERNFELTTAPE
jgi:hypothetical protein